MASLVCPFQFVPRPNLTPSAAAIPGVGVYLALLYIIARDCLTPNGSIGKYMLNLRIVDRVNRCYFWSPLVSNIQTLSQGTAQAASKSRLLVRGLIQFLLQLSVIGIFIEFGYLIFNAERIGDRLQNLDVIVEEKAVSSTRQLKPRFA